MVGYRFSDTERFGALEGGFLTQVTLVQTDYHMDRTKKTCVFGAYGNSKDLDQPAKTYNLIYIVIFYTNQCFYKRTVKALISLRGRAG